MPSVEWGFWEVLVGAIALLFTVAWALYERRKNRKDLGYSKVEEIVLTTTSELLGPAPSRLQVLFDDQVVNDPRLTLLEIKNHGRVPIEPDDYIEQLQFRFDDNTDVLAATKYDSDPDELDPTISIHESTIRIEPLLINGDESFRIRVITDGESRVQPRARIVGMKSVREYSGQSSEATAETSGSIAILLVFTSIILTLLGDLLGVLPERVFLPVLLIVIAPPFLYFGIIVVEQIRRS